MKYKNTVISAIASTCITSGHCQGFVDLNFESANVSGYAPGANVPIASALPGWNASIWGSGSTNAVTQIVYEGISTGDAVISIVDTNIPYNPNITLQGKFSAFLFGGGIGNPYSVAISQSGLVPVGTQALLFDAYNAEAAMVVTLDGQVINVVPLQTFSNYTLYGANIASFAGQVDTLSFIEPPVASGGPPSLLELDNIQFSPTTVVPEPGIFALVAFGGVALGIRRWRRASQ